MQGEIAARDVRAICGGNHYNTTFTVVITMLIHEEIVINDDNNDHFIMLGVVAKIHKWSKPIRYYTIIMFVIG